MLVAEISVWPFGSKKDKRQIGRLTIALITPGEDVADYDCRLDGGEPVYVRGHDRNDGALKLVAKAIEAIEREQPTGCKTCGGRIMHKMGCWEFAKEVSK